MDFTKQSQVIISFCTGIRGLDRGLERAFESLQWPKPRTAVYVENEMFCIANLVAAMETGMVDCAPIWSDAKTFDAHPFHGKIHGIIGGYPCQKFSLAGKREGLTEDHVWNHIEGSIEAIKPLWCFFENVDDHLSLGFDIVYKSLSNLGYKVEAGIYSAAEVGAPHERKRLFILAISDSLDCERWWNRQAEGTANESEFSRPSCENELADDMRKQVGRINERGFFDLTSGSGKELGNSESFSKREQADKTISLTTKWKKGSVLGSSNQLADTNSSGSEQDRQQTELRAISTEQSSLDRGGSNEGEDLQGGFYWWSAPPLITKGKNSLWLRSYLLRNDGRLPGKDLSIMQNTSKCDSNFHGWPARPGEQQFEWEEPRTVEPGMGSAINGYNFREDLLRALGNSVVEQTAELAFKDLVRKHIVNSKKVK